MTISAEAVLFDAVAKFEESKVDTIVVLDGKKPVGILDIQDII